jgi:hypothetical protein
VQDGRLLAVQVFQGVAQLGGPAKDILLGQESAGLAGILDHAAQILAGNEVHHQVIAIAGGEKI